MYKGNPLLEKEINNIVSGSPIETIRTSYKAILHTKQKDYFLSQLIGVTIVRDYGKNLGHYITLDFRLPLGDFIKGVYPYRNNLEITLIHSIGKKQTKERLKLVLQNAVEKAKGGVFDNFTLPQLNEQGFIDVEAQAIDKLLEALRGVYAPGIFKNTDLEKLMANVMLKRMKEVSVTNENLPKEISIIPITNKRSYEHIILPDYVKLLDIPSFLQNKDYGVYNGHIGTYLQRFKVGNVFKHVLFIYPLFNVDKHIKTTRKLIIVSSTKSLHEYTEKTYRVEGTSVKILANPQDKMKDVSDNQIMNEGIGFKGIDSEEVISENYEVDDEKTYIKEKDFRVSVINEQREDSANNRRDIGITNNFYKQRSEVMRRMGTIQQVQWNYSYADLLVPGMSVKFMYENDHKQLKVKEGILQSVQSFTDNDRKMTVSILHIFLKK